MQSFKHSFHSRLREDMGLTVYNTGYQKCETAYTWGPAVRDHYLIHYVASGCGTFTCGGKTYTLGEGDLFWVAPSEIVQYRADRCNPWEYYWVGFHGTEARRLATLAGYSAASPVLHVREPDKVRDRLLRIYRSGHHTPSAEAAMTGELYLLLSLLMAEHEAAVDGAPQAYLEQAVRFIQHNFAAGLSVEEIARHTGVSRSQLYRAFTDKFGLSPQQFLQQYRINEACSLLREPQYSVAEVAHSVGFEDPLYFSRVFRQLKECSPTAYRRRKLP